MEATEVEKIIIKKNPKFYDKNENSVTTSKSPKMQNRFTEI